MSNHTYHAPISKSESKRSAMLRGAATFALFAFIGVLLAFNG